MNTNYDIYQFFHKKSLEAILIYYLLTKRKEPLIYLEKLIKIRVESNGEDLKELGIQDGKKIGAMLGDNVEVGCGSILNPGSIIGRGTNIYPLSSVRGGVDANSIYKKQGEVAKKEDR